MAEPDNWPARMASLNQWTKRGERAPHKPLLLLYALGRLQRNEPADVSFTEARQPVDALLQEFGPPRKTGSHYPFHHLASESDLWVVSSDQGPGSPGSNIGDLTRSNARGHLAPGFSEALSSDPAQFALVVHALLEANFPETIHQEILDGVGIDVDQMDLTSMFRPVTRRRDPRFRAEVLRVYEHRCAVCGYDGQLGRETVGIEAAHVRWWAAGGPDEIDNAVALCSLHHKLLDRGVIGITPDQTVAVSEHFIGHGAVADSLVLGFSGRPLLEPQRGHPQPAVEHVEWHRSEVFHSPRRHSAVA